MIDTHCHLTFPELYKQCDDVVARAHQAGVDQMITICTTAESSVQVREVADRYESVFCSSGIHPHEADHVTDEVIATIIEAAGHDKCVAWGEMGLDYHYTEPQRDAQMRAFAMQLEMLTAHHTELPVVIHCRKATGDVLAMLREHGVAGERCVFHCFTEPPELCQQVLDYGARVSFTGIVTYPNAPEVLESSMRVPDDRIMVETDAPFLTPQAHRKIRPNEPRFVVDVAKFLADKRGMSLEDFEAMTDANARRFFRLPQVSQ